MELKDIGNKIPLGEGNCSKTYLLEDGNVLKLFNYPRRLDEIERFKYFLQYDNDSFVFPFEFIYDSKKFYGYITKYVQGETLENCFSKSNLINLSTHSYKLERNIDFVSEGNIKLFDLHESNVLYDGKSYSVIDHDENGIALSYNTKEFNQKGHRVMIGNLFQANIENNKYTKYILDKLEKYKYMKIRPSEMIIAIKEDMDRYYKENINTIEELNNIVRR